MCHSCLGLFQAPQLCRSSCSTRVRRPQKPVALLPPSQRLTWCGALPAKVAILVTKWKGRGSVSASLRLPFGGKPPMIDGLDLTESLVKWNTIRRLEKLSTWPRRLKARHMRSRAKKRSRRPIRPATGTCVWAQSRSERAPQRATAGAD